MVHVRGVRLLSLLVAGGAAAQSSRPAAATRLDTGLADSERLQPIFVRMADQLLPGAGALEAFQQAQRETPRSMLRARIAADLAGRSARARSALQTDVARLTDAGALRHVTWYWIVNGFAAEGSGAACRALAARDDVAFVYRQRGPAGHREYLAPTSRPASRQAARVALLEQVLATWRDDQGEPFTADGLTVPWNLQRIGADQVWKDERAWGQGVVVAINDSGLLPIPPLVGALWRNPKETLDGKDEDGDGLVDDVFGWDFTTDTPACLGDAAMPHGSMCAGIIAGRPFGEPRTVTGVAPRARIMVLKGMGYLRALEYAVRHGADVLSMSYMWVDVELGATRGLYRTAYEHLTACGVLAVGGAGNFGSSHPAGRQIAVPKDIPCVVAVAGILRSGQRPAASSMGPCTWDGVPFFSDYPADKPLGKPDLTALFGGFPVWSRVGTRNVARVVWQGEDDTGLVVGPQGNSFAGPHAAGVAALMLSANPELNPWEVKQILERTASDLGEPGRDVLFGAGLIQALPAVRAARAAVRGAASRPR